MNTIIVGLAVVAGTVYLINKCRLFGRKVEVGEGSAKTQSTASSPSTSGKPGLTDRGTTQVTETTPQVPSVPPSVGQDQDGRKVEVAQSSTASTSSSTSSTSASAARRVEITHQQQAELETALKKLIQDIQRCNREGMPATMFIEFVDSIIEIFNKIGDMGDMGERVSESNLAPSVRKNIDLYQCCMTAFQACSVKLMSQSLSYAKHTGAIKRILDFLKKASEMGSKFTKEEIAISTKNFLAKIDDTGIDKAKLSQFKEPYNELITCAEAPIFIKTSNNLDTQQIAILKDLDSV